nr:hypothetical protein [Tanacetum cinerariifolium]
PLAKETESFETDESKTTPPLPCTIVPLAMTRLCRERMTIRPQTSLSASTEACFVEYASAPTSPSPSPSPSQLTSYSYPFHHIPSPLLPIPSPPLIVPSPPLVLPSADRRSDIPEADMPSQKKLCPTTPASRVMTTIEEVNERVTYLAATQRQDAHEFYSMSLSYEREAVYARHAWSRLEDRSTALEALIRAHEKMMPKKIPTPMTDAAIKQLIAQGVADVLVEYESNRSSGNGNDSHDSGSSRRRTEHKMMPKKIPTPMTDAAIKQLIAQGVADVLVEYESNRSSGNGNDSHDSGSSRRRTEHVTRECTVGHDVAYEMTWKILRKMMTNKMFPKEFDVVKKYIGGLSDMIQGSVMATKPKTMQDAIEFENELMDQKIRTFAKRQAANKRKLDDNSRDNHTQQ